MKRRTFLITVALAPAVAQAGSPLLSVKNPAAPGPAFFNSAEREFIDAAIARLIPKDELGPGALEADVATFIDRQLGGPYGRAETWYMQGPWQKGTKSQGYQLKQTPAELYRTAISDIDQYCLATYQGKRFAQLDSSQQDEVLGALEKDRIKLGRVPAGQFFDILWHNTQEGFLADPIYGGNKDFAGWKLIDFPGPRYNYVAEVDQYGKPYTLPPVGIAGRDPRRRPV